MRKVVSDTEDFHDNNSMYKKDNALDSSKNNKHSQSGSGDYYDRQTRYGKKQSQRSSGILAVDNRMKKSTLNSTLESPDKRVSGSGDVQDFNSDYVL